MLFNKLKQEFIEKAAVAVGSLWRLVSTHQVKVGNKIIRVERGTVREVPDYDDAWFLACALRARTIVDVGANIGYTALLATLFNANLEKILLLDPNKEALAAAARNLILNNLSKKASFLPAFMSNVENQQVIFWTVGTGAAGSMYSGHAVTAKKANQYCVVETRTLDNVCEESGFIPELVKIDVEGAEGKVMSGASKCATHRKTRFLIEMHSNPELSMASNVDRILDWSKINKFSAWYLPTGQLLSSSDTLKHRGRCHLLVQPGEWDYPQWLRGIPQSAALETVLIQN